MLLWLLLLALFFLNSTLTCLSFHIIHIYIYFFFRINLYCSLNQSYVWYDLNLVICNCLPPRPPSSDFQAQGSVTAQGKGKETETERRSDRARVPLRKWPPEESGLCQKAEGDKRAEDSKPETEENCVNRWFCPLGSSASVTPFWSTSHTPHRRDSTCQQRQCWGHNMGHPCQKGCGAELWAWPQSTVLWHVIYLWNVDFFFSHPPFRQLGGRKRENKGGWGCGGSAERQSQKF